MGGTLLVERGEFCKENQLVNRNNILRNVYIFITWVTKIVVELFATFDFWRIEEALAKSIQKKDTLFRRKMFFFVYKRILDCISSKTFLKRVNKILISFIFLIVEPLREPFPYLKTDLNQNYSHNFSDMKIWQHFCIDFHCVEQKQSNYIGDALN